jgi:hypothetical protein
VIFNSQNQEDPSLLSMVWAKALAIGELLFLIGALVVVAHFVVIIVAIVGTVSKRYTVPSWLWFELCVLVYPLAPLLWGRFLLGLSTHSLRPQLMDHYIGVLIGSIIAFLLALTPTASYSVGAFPLLGLVYVYQCMLDGGPAQKKQRKPSVNLDPPLRAHHFHNSQRVGRPPQSPLARPITTQRIVRPQKTKFVVSTPLTQCVGIWYSPADKKFAQRLRTHLQPDIRGAAIELWDPDAILPGAMWEIERMQAIRSAAVAVVLVSADFLASDFLVNRELQPLLFRAQCQQTIVLILHVRSCNIRGSGLERFQAVNVPEKPLAKIGTPERDQVFTQVTRIIRQRLAISEGE